MVCKYLCIRYDRELPSGGMAVWIGKWEWAPEGDLKGFLLSREDGAGTSLPKPAYDSTHKSGRNAPSRVAPQDLYDSCPSIYAWGRFLFLLMKTICHCEPPLAAWQSQNISLKGEPI